MTRLVVFVLLVASALVQGRHEKYEGHQLYRVAGPSEEIANLEARLDILTTTAAARSSSGQLEALVRLSPEEKDQWLQYFSSKNMPATLIAENLATILREEEATIQRSRASRDGESISWDTYYRHEEINDYLDDLAARYPNLVTVINAALSFEGRQIKYVRLSTSRFENLRKPVIIIDAAAHAREWVTTPVALYIINQLVVNIADQELTDGIDWIIIPVVNPDGYEYSFEEDRLWRKTRSLSHEGSDECPGVDVNRNFDHYWGTVEANQDPCAIIYEGPSAFSESETRVVRDVCLQQVNRAHLYISLHSYGNMFLYAWGNNGTLPSNGLILHLAGVRMATAIDALALDKADRYIVGNAANVLYYSTGTSRDWTRAIGIPLTYTLELPGYEYGFLVPVDYVKQIVEETWAGIAEEHWLRDEQFMFNFCNHQVGSAFSRKVAIRGGSMIIVEKHMKYKERLDVVHLSAESTIELSSIKLEQYIVVCVYRPPSGAFEHFEEIMDEVLVKVCKSEKMLFWEQRIWGAVKLNRVMEIYYRSSNEHYLVSRVEIILIINNTDCSAYSNHGVGHYNFSGTLILPLHVGVLFYRLMIYTCSNPNAEPGGTVDVDNEFDLSQLPFGKQIQKQLPFYY